MRRHKCTTLLLHIHVHVHGHVHGHVLGHVLGHVHVHCACGSNPLLDLVRPRSNMGSGALAARIETNGWSETGSGAEHRFRTHQRGRDILWIPDRGVDEATDGHKRMLEWQRLVVLLDLLRGRLQEHLRLDRAHGVMPCARAKDPCGRHRRVPWDGVGLTELLRMDHWIFCCSNDWKTMRAAGQDSRSLPSNETKRLQIR